MLEFLKSIVSNFGKGLIWVYDKLVPDSVKDKFKDLGVQISVGSFKGMIFYVLKIFAHWYFLMAILGVIVVYRLFKALENAGILQAFANTVDRAINSVLYISEVCFPMILNVSDVIKCIQGAP